MVSQTRYVTCDSEGLCSSWAYAEIGQLLKAINKLPGLSRTEIDEDAILLRAYGQDTDVLIDRESAFPVPLVALLYLTHV